MSSFTSATARYGQLVTVLCCFSNAIEATERFGEEVKESHSASNRAVDSQGLLGARYVVHRQSTGPAAVASCRGKDKVLFSSAAAATEDFGGEVKENHSSSHRVVDSQGLLAARYIVQRQSAGPAVVAQCRGIDKVVAGGCSADRHPFLLSRSYRWRSLTGEGWECELVGNKSMGRAWAICLSDRFSTTANEADNLVAQCRVGQRIIGGGCRTSAEDSFLQRSAPLGNSSWQCGGKGQIQQAEALCMHEAYASTIVRKTGTNWTTATCPKGHLIISGGCVAKRERFSHSLQASHPIREAWTCGGRGNQKTAYAVCAPKDGHNSDADPTLMLVQQKHQQQEQQRQKRLQQQQRYKEAAGWKVSTGSCTVDVIEGRPCAMSPDFPKKYRSEDACTLVLKDTDAVVLEKFDTEMYFDYLKINNASHSGKFQGKRVELFNNTIVWSTDFFSEAKGWKICKAQAEEPPGDGKGRKPG